MLVLAANLLSSIIQPVFGYISDLKARPYLMSIGIITAALGIMFIGFISNYALLFASITLMGIGVALFHPEGGKMANCVSASNAKGKGMSIFSVGGNLGFAVGPLVVSGATLVFGTQGIMVVGLPALIMTIVFTLRKKKYAEFAKNEITLRKADPTMQEDYQGFFLLTIMIFFRSVVFIGLTTFTPLYFMHKFGVSAQVANINLTIIAICGVLATLVGGILADRIGFKQVMFVSSIVAVPFLACYSLANNQYLATLMLIPAAFAVYGTGSVSMVLGQKFLCKHIGFASGITVGLAMTFGGIMVPVLGYIADSISLDATVYTITASMVLTAFFAYFVPDIDKIRAQQKAKAISTQQAQ